MGGDVPAGGRRPGADRACRVAAVVGPRGSGRAVLFRHGRVFGDAHGACRVVRRGAQHRPAAVPALVASYVFAAYWFTASTSFANPAVTLARSFTDTFSGIRIADVAGFVAGQAIGTTAALGIGTALRHDEPKKMGSGGS